MQLLFFCLYHSLSRSINYIHLLPAESVVSHNAYTAVLSFPLVSHPTQWVHWSGLVFDEFYAYVPWTHNDPAWKILKAFKLRRWRAWSQLSLGAGGWGFPLATASMTISILIPGYMTSKSAPGICSKIWEERSMTTNTIPTFVASFGKHVLSARRQNFIGYTHNQGSKQYMSMTLSYLHCK